MRRLLLLASAISVLSVASAHAQDIISQRIWAMQRCLNGDRSACQQTQRDTSAMRRENAIRQRYLDSEELQQNARNMEAHVHNDIARRNLQQQWDEDYWHDREMARGYERDARSALYGGNPGAAQNYQSSADQYWRDADDYAPSRNQRWYNYGR